MGKKIEITLFYIAGGVVIFINKWIIKQINKFYYTLFSGFKKKIKFYYYSLLLVGGYGLMLMYMQFILMIQVIN